MLFATVYVQYVHIYWFSRIEKEQSNLYEEYMSHNYNRLRFRYYIVFANGSSGYNWTESRIMEEVMEGYEGVFLFTIGAYPRHYKRMLTERFLRGEWVRKSKRKQIVEELTRCGFVLDILTSVQNLPVAFRLPEVIDYLLNGDDEGMSSVYAINQPSGLGYDQ